MKGGKVRWSFALKEVSTVGAAPGKPDTTQTMRWLCSILLTLSLQRLGIARLLTGVGHLRATMALMVTVPLLAQAQPLHLGILKGSGLIPPRLGIAGDPTTISGIAQDGTAAAGTAENIGKAFQRKVAWECFEITSLYRFEFSLREAYL